MFFYIISYANEWLAVILSQLRQSMVHDLEDEIALSVKVFYVLKINQGIWLN